MEESNDHVYYKYPYGTSVLSVPFVLVYRVFGISTIDSKGRYSFQIAKSMQKTIAGILMAAVCVIFYMLSRVLLPRSLSLLITLVASLGTQIWSTAATGLWSHTWDVVILSLACLQLLRAEKGHKIHPLMLATLLSWGFFVRPTAVLYILPLTFYIWQNFRSHFMAFFWTGAFWLGLFLLHSVTEYGQLPHYYMRAASTHVWSFHTILTGFSAQLISPARGLLVYVPSILIVAYFLAANYKNLKHRRLINVSLLILALHTLLMSIQKMWWAGVSYGPRLYTDIVPIFVLLAVIAISANHHSQRPLWQFDRDRLSWRNIKISSAIICILAGILINGVGAISPHSGRWERVPYRTQYYPLRVFDWSSPTFLCESFPGVFCVPYNSDEIMDEFRLIDRNNDMSIDKREYRKSKYKRFETVDRNLDSLISLQEWAKIYGKN